MLRINKPMKDDLVGIRRVLSQWTFPREVKKYVERVRDEMEGRTQFNMHFWIAKEGKRVIGVVGIADPLPKEKNLARTENPGSLKILYIDGERQKEGIGTILVHFIGQQAYKDGYRELLVRSAERYRETAYGFYEKMGFIQVGETGEEGTKMAVFSKEITA